MSIPAGLSQKPREDSRIGSKRGNIVAALELEQTIRVPTCRAHLLQPAAPKAGAVRQRTAINGVAGKPIKCMHVGKARQDDLQAATELVGTERYERLPSPERHRMRMKLGGT